jgi:hypothetical protein
MLASITSRAYCKKVLLAANSRKCPVTLLPTRLKEKIGAELNKA